MKAGVCSQKAHRVIRETVKKQVNPHNKCLSVCRGERQEHVRAALLVPTSSLPTMEVCPTTGGVSISGPSISLTLTGLRVLHTSFSLSELFKVHL